MELAVDTIALRLMPPATASDRRLRTASLRG
jgi:hypothetical protein